MTNPHDTMCRAGALLASGVASIERFVTRGPTTDPAVARFELAEVERPAGEATTGGAVAVDQERSLSTVWSSRPTLDTMITVPIGRGDERRRPFHE